MQELEPTWNRSMRVWWLILWRGAAGLFGLIVGAIAGFIIGMLKGSVQTITVVSGSLGYSY